MSKDTARGLRANIHRLGTLGLVLAIIHFALGRSLLVTAVVGIILVVGYLANSSETGSAIDSVTEVFGINKEIFGLLSALVALVSFLLLLVFNPTWHWTAAVAFCAWAVFDSIQHLRHNRDNIPSARQSTVMNEKMRDELLYMNIAGYVARSLLDHPKTKSELVDSLDLTESQLEGALKQLQAADTIYFDGDRYHARRNQFGYIAFIRAISRDVFQRFVKPFRMG